MKSFHIPSFIQILLGTLSIWLGAVASFDLPGSSVPVSMQTLAVILVGSILGPRKAALAVGLYLLLGAIGLPVFANQRSGWNVLFGPTGGFLFSFWLISVAVGIFWQKFQSKNGIIPWIIFFLAHIDILIIGFIWLGFYKDDWGFPLDTLQKLAPGLLFKVGIGGALLWAYRHFVKLNR